MVKQETQRKEATLQPAATPLSIAIQHQKVRRNERKEDYGYGRPPRQLPYLEE